jgi:hypothetical protein
MQVPNRADPAPPASIGTLSDHSPALMKEGGPDHCNLNGNQYTFASDGVMELRAKYPGIADTTNSIVITCTP